MKIGDHPWRVRMLVCAGLLLNALFVVSPLYRHGILFTPDLINHVRHTQEYTLALREGQFPPLVAPKLNGALRIPLFQYYTGTAYTFPGALGLTGLDAYNCLKVTIVLFSFLGGLSLFGALRSARTGSRAAYLGAMTFQLFGFSAVDLYQRGGFPEWMSLHFAALVLGGMYGLGKCLTAPVTAGRFLMRFALCVLALVLFIPCHPTQTVYTGLVVLALAGAYGIDQLSRPGCGKFVLLVSFAGLISIALTAWFWLPICREYAQLRITGHQVYASQSETPALVFWPWHRDGSIRGWAPQLGPHITLAAVTLLALLLMRKVRQAQAAVAVVLLAGLAFLVVLPKMQNYSSFFGIGYHAVMPWVKPMQWSYRFLLPCALAGAWVVGLTAGYFDKAFRTLRTRHVAFLSSLCFLIAYSAPFIQKSRHDATAPDYPMAQVLADSFDSPNATLSYAMLGNDYRTCAWVQSFQLVLGKDIALPFEGLPFQAEVLLADAADDFEVFANGKQVATTSAIDHDNGCRLVSFPVVPGRGPGPGRFERTIRFESRHPPIVVADLKFLPQGDDETLRLPAILEAPSRSATGPVGPARFQVWVREEGAYQLPFCYTPDLQVLVNGRPAEQVSADRYLFTTLLPAGESEVLVRVGPAQAAIFLFAVGLGATGAFGVGVVLLRRSAVPEAIEERPRHPTAAAGPGWPPARAA